MTRNRYLLALMLASFTASALFAGGSQEQGSRISPARALELFNQGNAVLIDVRSAESYVDAHIAGAVSIPLAEVGRRAAEIVGKPMTIIAYCSCPAEETSLAAAAELIAAGAESVFVLDGGIEAWRDAGYPLQSGMRP